MRYLVRRKRSSPGQSLVEFSLVSLLLLATTFGIVDLGRSFQASIAITNAAREGARYASTSGGGSGTAQDTTGIQKRVRRELEGMNLAGASGARYSLLPPENATGNYVKVVQRLPVKIVLEKGQDPEHLLRPGMSVVPSVRVK